MNEPERRGNAGVRTDAGVSLENSPVPELSSPNFAAADQPAYAQTLFMGPDGLRPGWGLAAFVLVIVGVRIVVLPWVVSLPVGPLWAAMLTELVLFVAAAITAVVLGRIEHRPWGVYGLPVRQAFGKLFWSGVVWGFAAITLLLGLMYGLRAFDIGHIALHGVRIAKFAAFWGVMFLLVGFAEDFVFRGYAQFTLARGIGFWPAAVALSTLFGLVHLGNNGESLLGVLAAAAIGFFFCLTLRRTGSLWFAVGFHAAWDWGETFFYSVPDSGLVAPGHLLSTSFHGNRWLTGGTVGPEGSVLCLVVIAVAWVGFARVYRAESARAAGQYTRDPSARW